MRTSSIMLSGLFVVLAFIAPMIVSAQRATAAKYRTITVASSTQARVWVDGVYFGRTDKTGRLTIATITPGAHTLRLRADGYKERTMQIAATRSGDITVEMLKTTDEAELAFQEAERLLSVDREQAADAYRKAVRLRPAFPDAFVALARVLTETGDYDEAERAIASARRLKPGFAEASAVLARIYKEGGEEEKAIAAFKRAITEGRGFQPEAHTGLGLLYKDRAEAAAGSSDFEAEDRIYDEAARELKIAIKQLAGAPDALVIYQLLGLVYERQKSYTEAIATYEEFLRLFPNTPEATSVRSFIVQLKKVMDEK